MCLKVEAFGDVGFGRCQGSAVDFAYPIAGGLGGRYLAHASVVVPASCPY